MVEVCSQCRQGSELLRQVQDRFPDKIAAVVLTHAPDRNSPFNPPDADSQRIAGHLIEFLKWTGEINTENWPPNIEG